MKAIKRITLAHMPFDRWDEDKWNFVHATGDKVVLEDGSFATEYEDYIYEDAENCVYENESEWEDE